MRSTRPTLKVVAKLPTATPGVSEALDVIARAKTADSAEAAIILEDLRLENVTSPLLDDADKGFAGGMPDRHVEASKAFGETVYEVRDHEGAGWRGAVILDEGGDPWLVFVDKHDHFHASASSALKRDLGELKKGVTKGPASAYLPGKMDLRVRRDEEKRAAEVQLKLDLVAGLRDALRKAHTSGGPVHTRTPEDMSEEAGKRSVEYTVAIEHDGAAVDAVNANSSTSIVTISTVKSPTPYRMYSLLVSCGGLYVQPDANLREAVFTPDRLQIDLYVTHAKLAQLLSDAAVEMDSFPPVATPPSSLHWVYSPDHIKGVVTGAAVQGLCGSIFVPTESERASLPVCDECETAKPLAQELLDQLRLRAHS